MNGTKAIILSLTSALVLKLFVLDFMIAQGHSMEPAIENGAVLVINRLRYGFRLPWRQNYLISWAKPKNGEVLVFYTPTGELAVKRCIEMTEWGGFIVEGDNAHSSYDSRSYGQVPFNNIIGKVLGY
ncbi:MAG: S26 family signal peptidase [Treponema sp.]|nr:S26 family signal peptidase [Treponema sp.]